MAVTLYLNGSSRRVVMAAYGVGVYMAQNTQERGGRHVALLGDSILDNGAYTGGDPDVVTHLRTMLPAEWRASLCAVDGATTDQLRAQVNRVPQDASHLVVAIGGNDALQNADLLNLRVSSAAPALSMFAERIGAFERNYQSAIDDVVRLGLPLTLCTIYNGALDAEAARLARVGLMMFNDVILRTAFDRAANVIELRAICCDAGDYANPIEPSGGGGRKIAAAIARAVGAGGERGHASCVWAA
jgi:hypothetical protein